jgi:hypothetical protein
MDCKLIAGEVAVRCGDRRDYDYLHCDWRAIRAPFGRMAGLSVQSRSYAGSTQCCLPRSDEPLFRTYLAWVLQAHSPSRRAVWRDRYLPHSRDSFWLGHRRC